MVDYYGFGHWYKNTNMFDYFIKHKVVCISSRTKPYNKKRKGFQETFLGIKKGDNIFLKSYPRQKKALIIKATGKVICIKDNKKETDSGYCIEVEWDKKYDPKGLIDISVNSKNGRGTRIYLEDNSEIIRQINELIKK